MTTAEERLPDVMQRINQSGRAIEEAERLTTLIPTEKLTRLESVAVMGAVADLRDARLKAAAAMTMVRDRIEL